MILAQTVGALFAFLLRANTVESPAMTDPDEQSYCEYDQCRKPLDHRSTQGRRRRYCDAKCRSAARRQRDAARATASPPALAFARVLNAAIQDDGRSLRTLSDSLPQRSFISPAALSQWQNGRAVPRLTLDTLHRVHALERLLQLPSCTAARALYVSNKPQGLPVAPIIPQPRTGEDGPPKAFEQAALQLEQKIAALYGSDNTAMPLVAAHDHFVVGSKRWPLQSLVKLTVNPLRENIEHYWVMYVHSEKAPLTIEPIRGCASGHVIGDLPPVHINGEQQLLVATELTFPTLRAGENYTFEFNMKYGPVPGGALPEPLFQRFVTTPAIREVRLDIKFEGVRPRDLQSVRWPLTPANQPPVEQVAVKVDDEGQGEPITLTDPELAAYGYTWKWQSEYEALC